MFFPDTVGLFSLPVDGLKVGVMVHVFRDNTETVGVVHCLCEIISIELNDIIHVLNFR